MTKNSESEELFEVLDSKKNKSPKSSKSPNSSKSSESETSDKSILFLKLKDDKKTEIKYVYHMSDIHIRNTQRHTEYNSVFERVYSKLRTLIGNDKKSSLIVLTGDIMHTKTKLSPEAFQMAHQFFKTLNEIAPVILIPGNHDCNLSNKDRLDALSPIVDDVGGLDNLYYLKRSGIYQYHNIVFGVTSVFDDVLVSATKINTDIWKNIKQKNKYKIALYHGPVHGAKTDVGFRMNNEQLLVEDFDGYSYVMLGDIHKYQYLNEEKTIAYAGSLIQQSYGENLNEHGILKWDLEEGISELVEIKNDYGYCTVHVENGELIDTYIPKKPRIRFILENTNQMAYQEIIKSLEKKYQICEIVKDSSFKTKLHSPSQKKIKSKMTSYSSQESIISTYLSKKEIDEKSIQSIIDLHKTIYQKILEDKKDSVADPMHNSIKNQKWNLIELRFSNTLSYGKENVIDFSIYDPNKIIGIMAPNHYGKSAILDIILFCLFDKCSRGDRRDIMNKNEKTMYCSLLLKVGSQKYLIERIGNRSKNGLTVKIDVNFYSISLNDNGEDVHEKLNGIDKNDTNKKIAAIIGDYNDYLITCFSLQSGKNSNFIDMTQLQKKEYLNQILKLNVFEDCHNYAKEKLKKLSTELKVMEQSNFKNIEDMKDCLKKLNKEIKFLENKIKRFEQLSQLLNEPFRENVLVKYNELSEYHLESEKDILNTINKLQDKLDKLPDNEINDQSQFDQWKKELEQLENEEYYEQNRKIQSLMSEKESLIKKLVKLPKIESMEFHTKSIEEIDDRIKIIDDVLGSQSGSNLSEKMSRIDELKITIEKLRKSLKPIRNHIDSKLEEISNQLLINEKIFDKCVQEKFIGKLNSNQKSNLKEKISIKNSFLEHLNYSVEELTKYVNEMNLIDSTVNNVIDHHNNLIILYSKWLDNVNKLLEHNNDVDIDEIQKQTKKLNDFKLEYLIDSIFHLDNMKIHKQISRAEKELDSLMEYNGTKKEIDNLKQEKKLLLEEKMLSENKIKEISNYSKQEENNKLIQESIDSLSKDISDLVNSIERKTERINEIKNRIKKNDELTKKNLSNENFRKKLNIHLRYLEEYYTLFIAWFSKDKMNKKWINIKKDIEKELVSITKEFERKKIEYESCLKDIEEYLKVRKKFDEKSNITNDYLLYVKTMNYNGLPYEILKTYLPLIESDVNSILHSMVNFDIEFMFYDEDMLKEQKTKQLKSNMGCVDINICYHDMKPYNVQLASGFEKFIIGLAIRMTLCSISLTSKPNFLIIDEGWSCLDSDNLNNIGTIMNYIKTQYEHVIVISHLDEMKDQADYVINIEKKDGYSYIKIDSKTITPRKKNRKNKKIISI